ncbi:GGDEF domain-containing protein [Aquabacterium sp.]|uniref:GGDEF domain-containing protein n=1 Tax=Aquabacterium sp. TaxID=1872578 RepID=UPI00248A3B07|nr:GGDEF domain-containing protein [Aquabacterium sp.]MDI1258897.1 GGDEF domain-containing protein [Aquabacterium sp.]
MKSQAAPGSLEDVIEHGQSRLGFPPALEAEFQADTVAGRRRLLIICGMIGTLGVWFASDIVIRMFPDTIGLTLDTRNALIALAGLSQCVSLAIPRRHWKSQYFEFNTTVNTMVVGAAVIGGTTFNNGDAMFTHSAVIIGVVMYAGIAARQRYRWTFTSSMLTFIGYCTFVQGETPLQQLIVRSNVTMLALGLVLTLIASHGFEFRERRAWLLRKQSAKIQASLAQASEQLRELSVRDPLTGLYNRRHFEAEMAKAFKLAAQAAQPVSMLMLDVDFFKRYNDSHGHPAGDACLKQVACVLNELADTHGGLAGRLGGEEFGLILPEKALQDALAVGKALCGGVRGRAIEHGASSIGPHVTVSVGAAVAWPGRGATRHALVQAADQALYQAKHDGRDRAVAHAEPVIDAGAVQDEVAETAMVPGEASTELAQMGQLLARGFRSLFFPRDIEAAYQAHHQEERKRHLITAAVAGMLTFNVYVFANRGMFADVATEMLHTVVGLTVIMLAAVGATAFMPLKAWLRESFYALGTTVVAIATIKTLSMSHEFTTLGFAVALFLIPMFACVVARQPFWFALVPTVATIASLSMFNPVGPMAALIMEDTALIIINASVYTLIAAYALENGARKEWLLNEISRRQRQELETTMQHLHQLSVLDPLTGLSNRRQFEEDFSRTWSECGLVGQPVGLLIMDVDFFKNFNDRHGHPAGDRCLRQIATVLSDVARQELGLAARLGGEEFGLLLPGRDQAQAALVGQALCEAVRQARIAHGASGVSPFVTISVGSASMVAGQCDGAIGELLGAADAALYQAKASGRDRVGSVETASAEPVASLPARACLI